MAEVEGVLDAQRPEPDFGNARRHFAAVQRIGEAAELVALNPSTATLGSYTAALQSPRELPPANELLNRVLLVAKGAAAAARTITANKEKFDQAEGPLTAKLRNLRDQLTEFSDEIAGGATISAASGSRTVVSISALVLVFGSALSWMIPVESSFR